MAAKTAKIARFNLPRLSRLRSAAYTYRWTKREDHLLPDHYKKRALEFLTTDPKPVHWIPDERTFKLDKNGIPTPVQNVPIPVKYPKECNEGLWGGEGIVQGFIKKKTKSKNPMHGFRCPRLWLPKIHKEILYSEILDQWMPITVTKRTLNLIDKVYGLDHYILGTSERDLNSRLGMKLKREMLLALARKSMYPNDPKKRELVYERYKKYEIPEEEAEWIGLSVEEALEKARDLEQKKNTVIPLKEIFIKQLLKDLKEGKDPKAIPEDEQREHYKEKPKTWKEKINPFS